ncbi:zinc-finger domain-containing protein [Roseobacter sp. HKCCA0434]|uniref:zinc-finger domain-containing protein n=1 Tax=Roseobacter sp. HKCCA0434 TaxID=3079297 RepID=UPI002905C3F6|nr:zinc-finger domain-containing protein [Roseobacter sp. HKCCA0434]
MSSPAPAPETEFVTKTRIACDGGVGGLGHPRVWYSIAPETGYVDCGYCDKRFILKGSPADPDTAEEAEAPEKTIGWAEPHRQGEGH